MNATLKYIDSQFFTHMQLISNQILRSFEYRIVYPTLKSRISPFLLSNENKRRFNLKAYCIGLPRSGTHTMNKIFKKYYRSRHEPLAGGDVREILKGQMTKASLIQRYLINRDRYLALNFESSHYLVHFIEHFVKLFPDRSYIITMRKPRDWIISLLKQIYPMAPQGKEYGWLEYYGFIFDANFERVKFDKQSDLNLLIRNMLKYYEWHVNKIVSHVPDDKIFLIDTYKIFSSSNAVTEFLGVRNFKFGNRVVAKSKSNVNFDLPEKSERLIQNFHENYFEAKLSCGGKLG